MNSSLVHSQHTATQRSAQPAEASWPRLSSKSTRAYGPALHRRRVLWLPPALALREEPTPAAEKALQDREPRALRAGAAMAKYDVLLYGATGFTGTLTARYLDTHAALAGRRWAIAGRTQAKLEALSAELTASNPEVVCVSLQDAAAVEAMVKSSKVVLTCAGPYSAYNGRALLGCCAQNGARIPWQSGGWRCGLNGFCIEVA